MARDCYCGHLSKEFLDGEGIPEGYCGICERCGKPGHIQHFPGAVTYTGAWCDSCFRIVAAKYWIKSLLFSLLSLAVFILIIEMIW